MSFRSAPGRLGLLQISLAGMLWGTTGVVVRQLNTSDDLPAATIAFWRLAFAAAGLFAWAAVQRRPLLLGRAAGATCLIGVGLAVYQLLYFVAVLAGGVSSATIVSLGLAPVVTAAWEATRERHMPGARSLLVLLTGLIGLVLVTASPQAGADRPTLGLMAAVGSGLTYAATTVLSRHTADRVSPLAMATVSSAVGSVMLLPVALLAGAAVPLQPLPVSGLLYLGLATTALAYGLFYAGLRSTPGSTATLLTLLEPLTAALLAFALLGEVLTVTASVGAVLLLGCVAALYARAETPT